MKEELKEHSRVMYAPSKDNDSEGEIWIRIPVKGFDPASMDLTAYCCTNDSGTWNTLMCSKKKEACPVGQSQTVWM